jgi:hypothetical protein
MFRILQTILLILCFNTLCFAQTITSNSTINSIGYYIDVSSITSTKNSVIVQFKKTTETDWRFALNPVVEILNTKRTFVGSLLQLDAGTAYDIKTLLYDSTAMSTIIINKISTTQAEPNLNPIMDDTLWVSPTGSGNLFTKINPGSFKSLFIWYDETCNAYNYESVFGSGTNIQKVNCGTVIMCKGGIYNIGNLIFQTSRVTCTDLNKPIIIQSAPNEQAIFDGSDTTISSKYPVWTVFGNASDNIYTTTLPAQDAYSTLFLYDGVRLFPYSNIQNVSILGKTYIDVLNNCASRYGSGFYRKGNTYHIKLANGEDPNTHKITVSRFNKLLEINAIGSQNIQFIFKNITVKNYGKASLPYKIESTYQVNNSYPSLIQSFECGCEGFLCSVPKWCQKILTHTCNTIDYNQINSPISPILNHLEEEITSALYLRDCKNVIVDNCTFEYNTTSIHFDINNSDKGDGAIIQNCSFKDNSGLWNHSAYKNSALLNDAFGELGNPSFDNGKFGRDLQTAAIKINYTTSTLKNIVVRNNIFNGLVSTFSVKAESNNSKPAYDIDFNDNIITNTYNAMGSAEISCNSRAWNNKLSNCLVGFSTISSHDYPNIGPVYIFRNIFANMSDRNTVLGNDSFNYPIQFYINYNSCDGIKPKNWATVLKLSSGRTNGALINATPIYPEKNTLDIFFIHNTVFARDSFAHSFIIDKRNWRTITSINNIYSSNYTSAKFENVENEKDYTYKSTRDNYFSKYGYPGVVNKIHGNNDCINTNIADSLDVILRRVTGNNNTSMLQVKEGYNVYPNFVDTANNNYRLAVGSPLIDIGIRVPNISDSLGLNYYSIAPEIGAIENIDSNITLPVELISLVAKPINNQYIQVNWTTASELNTKVFQVLRSIDGVIFSVIDEVNAKGFSNYLSNYFIDDDDVNYNTIYYYKLKTIDLDNTFSYSKIVEAQLTNDQQFSVGSIFPNPTTQSVSILINTNKNEEIVAKVYNNLGEIQIIKQYNIYTGKNTLQLDMKNWANGIYYIQLQNNTDNLFMYKLIKN